MRLIAQLTTMLDRLKDRGAIDTHIDSARAAGLFYGICLTWTIAFATREDVTIEILRDEIAESVRMTIRGMLPRNQRKERIS
jgi:hypothetical protein